MGTTLLILKHQKPVAPAVQGDPQCVIRLDASSKCSTSLPWRSADIQPSDWANERKSEAGGRHVVHAPSCCRRPPHFYLAVRQFAPY